MWGGEFCYITKMVKVKEICSINLSQIGEKSHVSQSPKYQSNDKMTDDSN